MVSKYNFYWKKVNEMTNPADMNYDFWKNQDDLTASTKPDDVVYSSQEQTIYSTWDLGNLSITTKYVTGFDHAKQFIAKINVSTLKTYLKPNKKKNLFAAKVKSTPHKSIYGGFEVRLGDIPHHVYLYKMVTKFRAFCGGSIITRMRVLTSANCLLTNKKNIRPGLKAGLNSVHVVAGILDTVVDAPNSTQQQWRRINKLYSQEYYRHPQYNLAIIVVNKRWDYNDFVNQIAFTSQNNDYNGVCQGVAVKTTKSWSMYKQLYMTELKMMTRSDCEVIFMRSTRLFYCTEYDYNFVLYSVIPGGGLICHMTGDPLEVDPDYGILVGVTVQNQHRMPTLHQRVGMFHQWVVDRGHVTPSRTVAWTLFIACFIVCVCFCA